MQPQPVTSTSQSQTHTTDQNLTRDWHERSGLQTTTDPRQTHNHTIHTFSSFYESITTRRALAVANNTDRYHRMIKKNAYFGDQVDNSVLSCDGEMVKKHYYMRTYIPVRCPHIHFLYNPTNQQSFFTSPHNR